MEAVSQAAHICTKDCRRSRRWEPVVSANWRFDGACVQTPLEEPSGRVDVVFQGGRVAIMNRIDEIQA